jgi:hypothetical protein
MGNSFTTKDTKEEKIISTRRAFLVPFPFFAVFAFSFKKSVLAVPPSVIPACF